MSVSMENTGANRIFNAIGSIRAAPSSESKLKAAMKFGSKVMLGIAAIYVIAATAFALLAVSSSSFTLLALAGTLVIVGLDVASLSKNFAAAAKMHASYIRYNVMFERKLKSDLVMQTFGFNRAVEYFVEKLDTYLRAARRT